MRTKTINSFGTATLFLALAASLPAQWIKIGSYTVPQTEMTGLGGITTGPDGNLWVCQGFGDQGAIVRVTTSGVITTFPLPDPQGGPIGITTGSDGALWFFNENDNIIGRITTEGVISEYVIPTAHVIPGGITHGPDGALWFTEGGQGNRIARITTAGLFTEFADLPTPDSQPGGIVTGPDGALWFTEAVNKIGRITIAGSVTEYPTPTAGGPQAITLGPDGNLWFAYFSVAKIAKVTTAGVFTEYPTRYPGNESITPGPDGTLWFDGGTLGRITTDGVVTEYQLPLSLFQRGSYITTGPDHQLWFTGNLNTIVGYAPACALGLSIGLSGETLTVNFDIGTSVPAELVAYVVNDNGPRSILSQPFLPTPVPVPLTDSISVNPRIGVQGVEAALTTPTGAICSQGAFVN